MKFELCCMTDGMKDYVECLEKNGYEISNNNPHRYMYGDGPTVEIKSLRQLLKLMDLVECNLVLSDETITIYDDYIE